MLDYVVWGGSLRPVFSALELKKYTTDYSLISFTYLRRSFLTRWYLTNIYSYYSQGLASPLFVDILNKYLYKANVLAPEPQLGAFITTHCIAFDWLAALCQASKAAHNRK